MNFALIPAAGTGSRIGGSTAKQFLELGRIPIIIHTLRKFEECEQIDQIVVVLPSRRRFRVYRNCFKIQFEKSISRCCRWL